MKSGSNRPQSELKRSENIRNSENTHKREKLHVQWVSLFCAEKNFYYTRKDPELLELHPLFCGKCFYSLQLQKILGHLHRKTAQVFMHRTDKM